MITKNEGRTIGIWLGQDELKRVDKIAKRFKLKRNGAIRHMLLTWDPEVNEKPEPGQTRYTR